MIINESEFKTVENCLQLFNTHIKAAKQRKTLFDFDYYEIPSLTAGDIYSIMKKLEKVFFAEDSELTDDLTEEQLMEKW